MKVELMWLSNGKKKWIAALMIDSQIIRKFYMTVKTKDFIPC